MKILLGSLEQLEAKLTNIIQRLSDKYPDDPEKKEVLERMVEKLHETIEKIKMDVQKDYKCTSGEIGIKSKNI